jgi:hypothetical protein
VEQFRGNAQVLTTEAVLAGVVSAGTRVLVGLCNDCVAVIERIDSAARKPSRSLGGVRRARDDNELEMMKQLMEKGASWKPCSFRA